MAQKPLPATTPLNLDNIQGDILLGLPKKVEEYIFLQIKDVGHFRKGLAKLVPLITTTAQVLHDRTKIHENKSAAKASGQHPPILPLAGINIAFSNFGLKKLEQPGALADALFNKGQFLDAPDLGDPIDPKTNEPAWLPQFKKQIDLVIFISGDRWERVEANEKKVDQILGNSVHEVFKLKGNVRPGEEKGHEHFGFLDGISQPAVEDFNADQANPGQKSVPPGVILLGNRGDPTTNPEWTKDGSILAFRFLEQLVPEFNNFLKKNPIPGHPAAEGSELLGARLVGRWKSGAPVDLAPKKDDKNIAKDPKQNNNFDFNMFKPTNDDPVDDQLRCPFVAHVRKTNPRSDLPEAAITPRRIIRQGIPFGPEVTDSEKRHAKTEQFRGLAFVCYQSNLSLGFHFLQQSWANTPTFVPNKQNVNPGIDAIIGQQGNAPRQVNGTDPANFAQTADITIPNLFVVPHGGEYFFSPSIKALKDIAAHA